MSWNVIVYKNQLKKKQTNKQKSPRNSNESVMQSFPIFCSFVNNDAFVFGSGAWKFNNCTVQYWFCSKIHIKIINQTFKKSLPIQITQNGNFWNTR